MKNKAILLACFLLGFSFVHASAFTAAVGGEFGLPIGDGLPSAVLSFRVPSVPVTFGLGATIPKSGNSSVAVLADWWLAQGNLVSFLDYYVGPGLFLTANSASQAVGLRVPIGLDAYPIKPLEIFLEFAPDVTLISNSGVSIPDWGLQSGFGFRFWF